MTITFDPRKASVMRLCGIRVFAAVLLAGLVSIGPVDAVEAQIELRGSTPEDGAALDGPVRTVRVWFDKSPEVAKSTLTISGPGNRAKIEGLHTMGENDLMGRVTGPMPNGEWTMTWVAVAADGDERTGTVTFTVQRNR